MVHTWGGVDRHHPFMGNWPSCHCPVVLSYATVSNNTPSSFTFAFVDERKGVVCHSLAELGDSEADEDEEYVLSSMYIY